MRKRFALASCLLAASLAGAATGTAAAADTWPERPVKVIVGFAPGGPTDLVARLIAQQLAAQTGKNFFVENMSGAGGNVGTGPAVEATVGNHTPISFGAMAPAVPLIKNGDLRALAVTGKTRSPTLPDIPT